MPETRRKVTVQGMGVLEGVDVGIKETTERWTDVQLEDGTTLRVKPNVMVVTRIDGKYDPEGNPIYALTGQQIMTVTNVPPHLRKPAIPVAGVKAN
ncbi:MAG: hypothetical protein WBQ43_15520 [Terriglobales bacterium]